MNPLKSKKGFAGGIMGLAGAGLALVILIFIITIGADLTSTIEEQQTSGSIAENVSTKGLEALDLFGDWFDIIILIVIAVLIIGLLLAFRLRSGGM